VRINGLQIQIDSRDVEQIVEELLARRLGYVQEWRPAEKGIDAALIQIFARYLHTVIQRLNQAPEKNKLAFLDLLGVSPTPGQAARAPIVFQPSQQQESIEQALNALGPTAPASPQFLRPTFESRVRAGTQVAALPLDGESTPRIFETENAVGIATGPLRQVVSVWPDRDQLIDHTAALQASEPLQLFNQKLLQPAPHAIYLAHDALLALSGQASLELKFEFAKTALKALNVSWEYWDGEAWQSFRIPENGDGTGGLRHSGTLLLQFRETSGAEQPPENRKSVVNGQEAYWIRGRLMTPLTSEEKKTSQGLLVAQKLPIGVKALPEIETIQLTSTVEQSLQTKGFLGHSLDRAFNDDTALDTSRPFYPFGRQPLPGATFYFSREAIFSKPGAEVQMRVTRTSSPQDVIISQGSNTDNNSPQDTLVLESPDSDTYLSHVVAWEYWDGRKWVTLPESTTSSNPIFKFDDAGVIEFKIPENIKRTTVNSEDKFWLRVRLVSGGFGVKRTITFDTNTVTFIIPQPPLLGDIRLGYTWESEASSPERALTYNDFQYEDHSAKLATPGGSFLVFKLVLTPPDSSHNALATPGDSFLPFKPMADATPGLYLGFSKKLPADRVALYFDIVENPGDSSGPEMVWEYFNGDWREFAVEDETRNLRVPGIISFIGAADSKALGRFGVEQHWIRGRLKKNGLPGQPTINNIYPNAVWASQQRTVRDTPLGASAGFANQVFNFTQSPVLAGERIEVQELSGLRANVEWPILAMALGKEDSNIVRDLEEMLAREDMRLDVVRGDLRLRRGPDKRVTEVWVRWHEQPHFYFSWPEDRHYVIDRHGGRVFFGDGSRGAIPPAGAAILARESRTGGGLEGNVPERAINQLLADAPGVEAIFNPRPAEGGADGEPLSSVSGRGPFTIRAGRRAITLEDYATLAHEASPAVARTRVLPNRDAAGRFAPGSVTVQIIPYGNEDRPQPSFGLREHVRSFITEHAPSEVAQPQQIIVIGPLYQPIDVEATIAAVEADEAGAVEKSAREALQDFLHPLRGGPERLGWEPGRDVFLSDVAAVLERIGGVDYVEELTLSQKGISAGNSVPVPDDRIVVAGNILLKLK